MGLFIGWFKTIFDWALTFIWNFRFLFFILLIIVAASYILEKIFESNFLKNFFVVLGIIALVYFLIFMFK